VDAPIGAASPETTIPSSATIGTAGADQILIRNFIESVQSLLEHEKFDQLDAMADAERSGRERFPGGDWKLQSLYMLLEYPSPAEAGPPSDADYERRIALLRKWITHNPSSVTARIALAGTYTRWGWKARGNGYADTVTDEGWRLLHKRDAVALAALRDASRLSTVSPEWFVEMLTVAHVEDFDKLKMRALVDKAFAVEPDYYYVYQTYASFLLPKWNGEQGDARRFADEISNRIGGARGDMMYYEIAVSMACGACGGEQPLRGMDWSRVKRGFAANEKSYGISTYKLNQMALAANDAGDYAFAATLFERIGENWSEGIWKSKADFEAGKRFAFDNRLVKLK
jgi:hypothetical protein